MVTLSPTVTLVDAGSRLTVGGPFFLSTVTSVAQEALNLPSETVTVTLYLPGARPDESKVAFGPVPVTFAPPDALHE